MKKISLEERIKEAQIQNEQEAAKAAWQKASKRKQAQEEYLKKYYAKLCQWRATNPDRTAARCVCKGRVVNTPTPQLQYMHQ